MYYNNNDNNTSVIMSYNRKGLLYMNVNWLVVNIMNYNDNSSSNSSNQLRTVLCFTKVFETIESIHFE